MSARRTTPLDPVQCANLVASPRWAAKVAADDPETGCRLWLAATSSGYGSIVLAGKRVRAHRVAYVAATGQDIPPDLELDHLCSSPPCVNPDHLEAVSHRGNVLRGESPTAVNARRVECPQGHPLDGPGAELCSLALERGVRRCIRCRIDRARQESALLRMAASVVGVSVGVYTARYGWSIEVARSVLESRPEPLPFPDRGSGS